MKGTSDQRRGDNSGRCHRNVIRLRPLGRGEPHTPASELSATSLKYFPGEGVVNMLASSTDQRST